MKNNGRKSLYYLIVLRKSRTGYCADVPDLPGCVAAAATIQGCRRLIAEAISLHLDLMRESGEATPAPSQQMKFTIDKDEEEELCTWVKVPELANVLRGKKKGLKKV